MSHDSYFVAKMMNPHRKCDLYENLKQQAEKDPISLGAILMIDEKIDINSVSRAYKNVGLLEISRCVGHFLGDFIYEKMSGDKTSAAEKEIMVHEIFRPWISNLNFLKVKKIILSGVNYKKSKKNLF
jgi:hypothetical protein